MNGMKKINPLYFIKRIRLKIYTLKYKTQISPLIYNKSLLKIESDQKKSSPKN